MVLCDVCQHLDLRVMLQQAIQGKRGLESFAHNRGMLDDQEYHSRVISKCFKHQASLAALKATADEGCRLCFLIWQVWSTQWKLQQSDLPTDKELRSNPIHQGQIYISCYLPEDCAGGLPRVLIDRHPCISGPLYTNNTRNRICDYIGELEAFATRDQTPADTQDLLATEIHQNSRSSQSLLKASEWLRTCLSDHPCCSRKTEGTRPLPTRVIDVGSADGSQDPHVYITHGRVGTWAALSYCWGQEKPLILNDQTYAELEQGKPLEEFPPTLGDAITVTRSLGIRYLWVDAICIKQDDESDWLAEASKMRDVYKGAQVTISAARADSCTAGLFSSRTNTIEPCSMPWYETHTPASVAKRMAEHVFLRFYSDDMVEEDPMDWPLSNRGWTLQEDKLSWRTLIYGQRRMFWKCVSIQVDEGHHVIKPPHHKARRFFPDDLTVPKNESVSSWKSRGLAVISQQQTSAPQPADAFYSASDLYHQWYTIVSQYTDRLLTFDTDILPALAGLASEFARLNGDTYCAGLWKDDLICGLLWRRKEYTRHYKYGDELRKGPADAPSWSWAGVHGGPINWFHHESIMMTEWAEDLRSAQEVAKVLKVRFENVGPDMFGRLKRGVLTIKAPFYSIIEPPFYSPGDIADHDKKRATNIFKKALQRSLSFRYEEILLQHISHPGQRYGLLQMVVNSTLRLKVEFLLVESTGKGDFEYRRLAWLWIDGGRKSKDSLSVEHEDRAAIKQMLRDKWPLKVITLV